MSEDALDPDDRHLVLAAARDHGADLSTATDDLIGFVAAVRRRLGLHPTDWTRVGHADALLVLDGRLRAAAAARRPDPHPTSVDESVARALHTLRPGALPWHALARAAHTNLAASARSLRHALQREGWTPPADAYEQEIDRG